MRINRERAFVGRLHQPWAAATHDIAAHSSQIARELLDSLISRRAALETGRAKNRDAIILASGTAETSQVIHHFPQPGNGTFQQGDGGVLVTQLNNIGLPENRTRLTHVNFAS